MRIAISGMFWTEPHVGSGQYLHNLIAQFAAQPAGHRFILILPRYLESQLVQSGTSIRRSLPHIQTVSMPTPFDRRNANLAKVWFEQVALGQVCRKLRADLIHVPYLGAPRYSSIPVIVTVHDLIPLLPDYRGGRAVQIYTRLVTHTAQRASAIIADSQHTRRDLIEMLGIPEQRIAVTYLAASPLLQPQPAAAIAAVNERFRLADPYILYIGGFDVRKNVITAIRAFARMRQNGGERVVLVIAGRLPTGGGTLFPDINRVVLEEGIAADVALLGPVTEEEKAALMSGCVGFVYPSRYEGFGLPPLEAMQCGAPVLAAATTSVGEVVGDGGVRLPPDDTAAWAAALSRVVRDADWRAELRQRGLERAAGFDWQRTAQQTLALYERVGQPAALPVE